MHSWDQLLDFDIPHGYLSLTIVDWVLFFDMDTRGAPPPSHAFDTPLPITLAETFAATDCPGQRREADDTMARTLSCRPGGRGCSFALEGKRFQEEKVSDDIFTHTLSTLPNTLHHGPATYGMRAERGTRNNCHCQARQLKHGDQFSYT